MNPRVLRFFYISALTAALFATVLLFDQIAILFALGPTTYFLALAPSAGTLSTSDILIGHLTAISAGWLADVLFTQTVVGIPLIQSGPGLRLVASLVLALGLTAVVLHYFTGHIATAHLTAMVVGLGALSTPVGISGLILGVGLVASIYAAFHEISSRTTRPPIQNTS